MLFTLISSLIGCAPDVYCYPEEGSTEGAEESSIPTPSQDLEDKEPSSEPAEEEGAAAKPQLHVCQPPRLSVPTVFAFLASRD